MKIDEHVGIVTIARDVTERKKAEEALTKSEARYRSLVNSAPDGIMTTDMKGVITSINPAFEGLTGFSKDEIVGKHFTRLPTIHMKGIPKYLKLYSFFIRGKKFPPVEFPYRRKDGKIHWGEAHPALLKEGGKNVGIQVILREITERKILDDALRGSEEKWRSLAENAPNIIIIVDRFGAIQFINRTVVDARPEEIVGKSIYDFIGPEHHSVVKKTIEQVFQTGEGRSYEISGVGPEGSVAWYATQVGPIKQDGRIVSATLITTDITKRKKTEESLRESEQKFRCLVEDAAAGVGIIDLKGRFIYVNKALAYSLGYSVQEMAGRPFKDFLHPDDRGKLMRLFLKSILLRRPSQNLEFRVIRRDGLVLHWISKPTKLIIDGKTVGFQAIITEITERKKAEEALRESSESYKELAESIGDVFFAMDRGFRYTYWNKASEKLTGISAKDAIGKSLTEVFPDVKGTRVEQFYREASRTQQPQSFLNQYQVGGKDYVFEINAYPTKTGLSVFVRDITERKKAEDALRKSEGKYRTLLENLPQKIFFKDRDLVYVSCNENYARDLKIKSNEIVGKTDYDFYPGELAEKYRADDERIMRSGKTEDIEEEYIQNGQKVFVHTIKTPVKDENGNVIGVLGVFWDVTELRLMEQKYGTIVRTALDGFWINDSKGRFIAVNDAYCRMIGYTSEELLSMFIHDIEASEKPEETAEHIKKILKEGHDRFETCHRRKDGTVIDVEVSVNYYPVDEGQLVVFIRDVTERKNMQKQLKEYSEHLEEKVEERTNQLKKAQEQLLKAERLAAIGEVATMVGHDLRNPLQAITNAVYFLKNSGTTVDSVFTNEHYEEYLDLVPEPTRNEFHEKLAKAVEIRSEMINAIDESIKYADKIVSDLQDFARNTEPEPIEINLESLIQETLSGISIPKNVKISMKHDQRLSKVYVDPNQLRRVFTNLTTNAIQAMENGGTLTISTNKTNGFLEVSFKDTGVGIPKENMEKLFLPLFTTKAERHGYGLARLQKVCRDAWRHNES